MELEYYTKCRHVLLIRSQDFIVRDVEEQGQTIALFRGQIIRSFRFHPFVLYGFVVGGWFMISQTIQRISKDRIKIGMHFRPVYLWIALAIVLINLVSKRCIYFNRRN